MKNVSANIAERIKKEGLRPTPRWIFVMKNVAFWGLFVVVLLLGAVAFSLILFAVYEADFELVDRAVYSPAGFFLTVLPFSWIILFFLFLGLAVWVKRHTKQGYRIPFWLLITLNLSGSIAIGIVSFSMGGSEYFEDFFSRAIPGYMHMDDRKMEMWSRPEDGLLSGIILEISSDTVIILEDFSGKVWDIDLSEARKNMEREMGPKKMRHDPKRIIFVGAKVKMIGKTTGEQTFFAEIILPWKRPKPFRDYPPPHDLLPNMMEPDMMNPPPLPNSLPE